MLARLCVGVLVTSMLSQEPRCSVLLLVCGASAAWRQVSGGTDIGWAVRLFMMECLR